MNRQNQSKLMLKDITQSPALKFVVLLGVVSLLSDMTYEGARSINEPFLALLGGGATVARFGELIGYGGKGKFSRPVPPSSQTT